MKMLPDVGLKASQLRSHEVLAVIQITVWIQECFKVFWLITSEMFEYNKL